MISCFHPCACVSKAEKAMGVQRLAGHVLCCMPARPILCRHLSCRRQEGCEAPLRRFDQPASQSCLKMHMVEEASARVRGQS